MSSSRSPVDPQAFTVHVPDERIADLHARLARTHLVRDPHDTWRYGVPTATLDRWITAWRTFDWRAAEEKINGFEHFRVVLDEIPIHYLLRRSSRSDAVPLLLLHGWPWTFWDYHELIEPLAEPDDPATIAFDVVVPSLPGHDFSTPVPVEGIGLSENADLMVRLMVDVLGYERFALAGGDKGCMTAGTMGHRHADRLYGIQLFGAIPITIFTGYTPLTRPANFGFTPPAEITDPVLRPADIPLRLPHGSAHSTVHTLEPQTLAVALLDSPAGLAAWLLHRRELWGDNRAGELSAFSEEFLLTTLSLYWYTDCIGSSMRRYHDQVFWPMQPVHDRSPLVEAPTAIAFFDGDEITSRLRFWVHEHYNVVRVTSHPHGGHFAPAEVPDACLDEIRATFTQLVSPT